MKDIRIISDTTGPVDFAIYGEIQDGNLALLQRIYVLLFSNPNDAYRGSGGINLLDCINGANRLQDDTGSAIVASACTTALSMLDAADRARIGNLSGNMEDGKVNFILTLKDGTTIRSTFDD